MKEIRKAGHDALAIIVEEFKVKPNASMKLFRNHVLTKKDLKDILDQSYHNCPFSGFSNNLILLGIYNN